VFETLTLITSPLLMRLRGNLVKFGFRFLGPIAWFRGFEGVGKLPLLKG